MSSKRPARQSQFSTGDLHHCALLAKSLHFFKQYHPNFSRGSLQPLKIRMGYFKVTQGFHTLMNPRDIYDGVKIIDLGQERSDLPWSWRMLSKLWSLRIFPTISPYIPSRNLTTTRPNMNFVQSRLFSFKKPGDYDRISNETLECLYEDLEALNDSRVSPAGYDLEYSSGVLTLKLGIKGTYVINRQPPNQQIWLSSPVSGPKRYEYDLGKEQWIYKRDGSSLPDLLRTELKELLGQSITIR